MMLNPELLKQEIDSFYAVHPDALLIGSLGRAAYFGENIGNCFFEFENNGQEPLTRKGNKPRDIDFILPTTGVKNIVGSNGFDIDTSCFDRPEVKILNTDGDWWLTSETYDFAEKLNPIVMEPHITKTVYGIDCVVPPAQTLVALSGIPLIRPKDVVARKCMDKANFNSDIPEEFFEPFYKLHGVASDGVIGKACDIYRSVVPESIRIATRPVMRRIRAKLIRVEKSIKSPGLGEIGLPKLEK